MAGIASASPGGFSYAQAAKGRAPAPPSQSSSAKGASGPSTPATGALPEPSPARDWADDVDLSVKEKAVASAEVSRDRSKQSEAKSSAVERAKSEDKAHNHSSGISSPDLAGSASSHDDVSSAQNGSSQTSWEAKSQASEAPHPSEPAWIVERKERQTGSQAIDAAPDGKNKSEDSLPKASPALHDAPPPAVNPWTRRAEVAKAKLATQPSLPKAAPRMSEDVTGTSAWKENQKPKSEARKNVDSSAGLANDKVEPHGRDTKPSSSHANARPAEVVISSHHRPSRSEHHSLSNASPVPPSVNDETSWPTPETAQEKERKAVAERETEEDKDDDNGAPGKPRKKPEWKPVPVVPNIIWETPGVRERGTRGGANGDRGPRGGASSRGRGGLRGGSNGVAAADRSATRGGQSSDDPPSYRRGRSDTADRDTMPPPPKPHRASSNRSHKDNSYEYRTDRPSRRPISEEKKIALQSKSAKDSASTSDPSSLPGTRRSKSPKKIDSVTGAHDETKIPEPIPRRISLAQQAREASDGNAGNASSGTSLTAIPSETRKEVRSMDPTKDAAWSGTSRGTRRGRGRGGAREFGNGHSNPYSNGHSSMDFTASSPYTAPISPSAYSPLRGNHQNSYSGHNRGAWRGGTPRTQSIPHDSFYGRFGGPYPGASPQLAPLQTYQPAFAEFTGYPISAVPYPNMMDHGYLMHLVGTQLDYYFSLDNLLKDMFLRQNMDSQGFVYLEVIASFNRIKQLTTDMELVKAACLNSGTVEIRVGEDGKDRLRKAIDWEKFIVPINDRFPAARNDGPSRLNTPERPMMAFFAPPPPPPQMHMRGPASAPFSSMQQRSGDRRSYDQSFGISNGLPGPFIPDLSGAPGGPHGSEYLNGGDEGRGRPAKSPMRDNSASPAHQPLVATAGPTLSSDGDADTFQNQHVAQLTVCVKMKKEGAPFHSAASRTFSNGSIDARYMAGNATSESEATQQTTGNGEPATNG